MMRGRIPGGRCGRDGSLVLGLAALIMVLGALCGAVLMNSLEAYRSSSLHTSRLQATAAAEGAAVAWQADPAAAREPLMVGDSRAVPSALLPSDSGTTASGILPFQVEVLRAGRVLHQARYRASYTAPGAEQGAWKLERLEALP